MLRRDHLRCLASACGLASALLPGLSAPADAQSVSPAFKTAFYNIMSGLGQAGLPGSPTPFASTYNCTDSAQPLNAWGTGFVQAELVASIAKDPSVVVLGLAEAWRCATPEAVQQALGWASRTGVRNGQAVIARYGFAGPETWLQLDTSRNVAPADTKWVVRVPVCLDAGCSRWVHYVGAHWGMVTPQQVLNYAVGQTQAQQTLQFMAELPAGEPRVLMGDLNVTEGHVYVCDMAPSNVPIQMFRQAGFLDAWRAVHGLAEGFTGMWNRNGCGVPTGNLFKRIDYTWSRYIAPLSVTRFGMVAPGTAAPSDHAGLLATFPVPDALIGTRPPTVALRTPADNVPVAGTIGVSVDAADDLAVSRVELMIDGVTQAVDRSAPYSFAWDTRGVANGPHLIHAAATDVTGHRVESLMRSVAVENVPAEHEEVVLHASQATAVQGGWALVEDSSAASRRRVQNTDAGASTVTQALLSPSSYVEFSFIANAGTPYRLWIRGRATGNSPANDSVHLQFDGSVTSTGTAISRIGTHDSTGFVLEDCDGCGLAAWGWQDNGVGRDVLGPLIYFARTGVQRLRIQTREDGLGIDQIVLSAVRFRWRSPGTLTGDTTILPSTTGGGVPAAPNAPPTVTLTSPSAGSTFTAPASVVLTAQAADADGGVARVEFFAGATRVATVSVPPYGFTWSHVAAGRYAITARATDTNGAAVTTAAATIDVHAATLPSGWMSSDVGRATLAGSTTVNGTTYTMKGSGVDIWGAADAFHYAYRPFTGDGGLVARVAMVSGSQPWAKVGVMIRASTAASSPHAFMLVSLGKGLAFQRRTTAAGVTTSTSAGAYTAPRWVKLARTGNVITASVSADGTRWTMVGADTVVLPATALFGIAVTSHDVATLATGTVDNVSVSAVSAPGWTTADIGATGRTGSSSEKAGTFTLRGAGADIWGAADAFHYAYRSLAGNGAITARVASLSGTQAWTKVGVMIRASTDRSSAHGSAFVSLGKGLAFQRRTATGGLSTHTSGGSGIAPHWLRLARAGNVVTASVSTDGVTWRVVGSDTLALPSTVLIGLAVSSHDAAMLATGTFDRVVISSAP